MKPCPFEISPQRLLWLEQRHAACVAEVAAEAARRLSGMTVIDDARRGFGTVYLTGSRLDVGYPLTWWNWRYANPEHYPEWLGVRMFCDEPVNLGATASLAARTAAASAFAEAVNAFCGADCKRFVARPLEIVVADAERPVGIYPGDDADVLAIDLMAGMSNSKIVDQLVWQEHKGDLETVIREGWDCTWLRINVWHRAERLNAARAMLDPTLPAVLVPGIASLRRRIRAAEEMIRAG